VAGYLVPEVWCDVCAKRIVSDSDQTLSELRRDLREQFGWRRLRKGGGLIDVCEECERPSHSGSSADAGE